jgi:hypothetical protein
MTTILTAASSKLSERRPWHCNNTYSSTLVDNIQWVGSNLADSSSSAGGNNWAALKFRFLDPAWFRFR